MGWLWDIIKAIPHIAFLKKEISDLKAKVESLEAEEANLKDDLRHTKQERDSLKDVVKSLTHKPELVDEQVQIIIALANDSSTLFKSELKDILKLQPTHFDFHFEALLEQGYLKKYRPTATRPARYGLSQQGRDYAIKNNLA